MYLYICVFSLFIFFLAPHFVHFSLVVSLSLCLSVSLSCSLSLSLSLFFFCLKPLSPSFLIIIFTFFLLSGNIMENKEANVETTDGCSSQQILSKLVSNHNSNLVQEQGKCVSMCLLQSTLFIFFLCIYLTLPLFS